MPRNETDFAVVVGVNHYNGIKPLNGPKEDAGAFMDWLLAEEGGNIPNENCKLVLSEEDPLVPLQDDIDDRFGEILRGLKKNGNRGRRLYFYFSGHGLGINWDETALVLPKWSDLMRNYALSSKGYLDTLVQCGYFQEIFFFLDCCRNRIPGITGAIPRFGNVKPAQGTASCDSFAFFSTEFDNAAYEAEIASGVNSSLNNNLVRGLFTIALINGLKGAAAKNGEVTTESLFQYLQSYLPELASKQQKSQIPKFVGTGNKPITGNLNLSDIEVNISFTQLGRMVILEDPNLNVIKTGITDLQKWRLKLQRGNYCIRYEDGANEIKHIRIDGSQNPFVYEF